MADIESAQPRAPDTDFEKSAKRAPRPVGIANPAALGLLSFASTTFILSLYNVNTRSIHTPNVVVGMGLFSGGLAQFMAGMWEFPRGNAFGATAFASFGAFWMSYATILIPGSGVTSAYATQNELSQALGIYLITWFVLTFLLFIGSFHHSIAVATLLFFLSLTFLLLGIGEWSTTTAVTKTGGAFGIITSWIAFYCGLSYLLLPGESYFSLPLGDLHKRAD